MVPKLGNPFGVFPFGCVGPSLMYIPSCPQVGLVLEPPFQHVRLVLVCSSRTDLSRSLVEDLAKMEHPPHDPTRG